LIIALFAVNDAGDLIRTCAPCAGQSADVKFSNPRRNSKKITGNGQEWKEKRTLKNLLNESASSTTSVKLEKWPFCPPSKFRTLDLGSEPNIRVYDSTALNAKGKTPNNLRT
jgi:hypothetical protein